jgi:hypothetical protein
MILRSYKTRKTPDGNIQKVVRITVIVGKVEFAGAMPFQRSAEFTFESR